MNNHDVNNGSYSKKVGKTVYEIVSFTAKEGYTMKQLLIQHIDNKLNSGGFDIRNEETAEK